MLVNNYKIVVTSLLLLASTSAVLSNTPKPQKEQIIGGTGI